uniref:Uncharacterized protein n=1 Tax=Oryza brachyantha TaxID=4533 RepID=J3MSI1_ORYBR
MLALSSLPSHWGGSGTLLLYLRNPGCKLWPSPVALVHRLMKASYNTVVGVKVIQKKFNSIYQMFGKPINKQSNL